MSCHSPCATSTSDRCVYSYSTPIYTRFHPTTSLESLPLCSLPPPVEKRDEEKILHSAIIICPTIKDLEVEEKGVMRKPRSAQVETVTEELDERFMLPKRGRTWSTSSTHSHSGHSMVISECAHAACLANACPALQCVVFPNGVQWHCPSPSLPRSRSSPCLPFDELFVKKIDRDVVPLPPPRKVIPLMKQWFMKAEQCFDLKERGQENFYAFL
ncbi:hypothetical protein EV421DRAFT_1911252 [Armillaria borealis]|uniref:Uncharacterized protein n=1 Tax=Armillaria borealis TaxID=47425 RepID=A0AA39MEM5_9AGAR|nr:hypothetical protein EV421DRAFT_1911252 [Armillaria borealis]